jgi:SAM-dependent methyltransferase
MRYDAGAEAYDRLTGRWSSLFSAAALNAAAVATAQTVLDVATGTGDAALLAKTETDDIATVIGVDISLPMLQVADRKYSARGVKFAAADATKLPFRDGTFDAVLCQFGLMFFPNRVSGLRELRRVLRSGGRVALTVWGPPDRAPFAGLVAVALGRRMPTECDELLLPFALANPAEVESLLLEAGFRNVRITREAREARFASFDDFWTPYEQGGGRLGQAYLSLPLAVRGDVQRDVKLRLADFALDAPITMTLEAYLATAAA